MHDESDLPQRAQRTQRMEVRAAGMKTPGGMGIKPRPGLSRRPVTKLPDGPSQFLTMASMNLRVCSVCILLVCGFGFGLAPSRAGAQAAHPLCPAQAPAADGNRPTGDLALTRALGKTTPVVLEGSVGRSRRHRTGLGSGWWARRGRCGRGWFWTRLTTGRTRGRRGSRVSSFWWGGVDDSATLAEGGEVAGPGVRAAVSWRD